MGKTWKDKDKWVQKQDKNIKKTEREKNKFDYKNPKISHYEWYNVEDYDYED